MKLIRLIPLFLLCLYASAQETDRLDFLEAFALGDRQAALDLLVPETDAYSYYACLHYELEGDAASFDREMARWKARNGNREDARMRELLRRRTLGAFETDPDRFWEFLRTDAGLNFQHRPRHAQPSSDHPSRLRPEQVSLQAFLGQLDRNHYVRGFTDAGLELAMLQDLNDDQRRELLARLQRPDVPNLVSWIVRDLQAEKSRGFGHHTIHRLLTRSQLEDLGRRLPSLLRNAAYVQERLARIQPPPGDLAQDHKAAVDYYEEVWTFVQNLGDMHNSLKASTLFRLLDHQRRLEIYEEDLFRKYLSLPRPVPYLAPEWRGQLQRQRATWVDFGYRPGREILLPPIGNEESLVRDFLFRFLRDADAPEAYAAFFEENWLGQVFAESKLLAGVGAPADWARYLPPDLYRRILDRVEVNLALSNPARHAPSEPVALTVDVKNVERLLVKIYEIHPFNYYRIHRAPVDQAVDLDGMVPTHEKEVEVSAPAVRRVRHVLELPEITERGVYVVELIGNGVSSRALLHLGHLEAITQVTGDGLVLMVLNESGDTVRDARVWLEGQEFTANDQGLVLLPFSENPGPRFVILRDGDFASPEQIQHPGESYAFTAGIHLDEQDLIRRTAGTLILRPDLRLHGFPVSPSRLEEVKVALATVDAKGTRSEREFDAAFEPSTEWVRSFYVPEGLREVEVSVSGRLRRRLDGEEITLTDHRTVVVNPGRAGDTLRQVFLMPSAAGWSLEVRGLNGEPVAGEPLTVQAFHPAFTRNLNLPVTTDDRGRVALGELPGISRLRITGHGLALDTPLLKGRAVLPTRLHLLTGETISLPYPVPEETDLQAVSLMRQGRGVNLEDHRGQVSVADGELSIQGLAAGEYRLELHELGSVIQLEVVDGENRAGFLLGKVRRTQATDLTLPSLAEAVVEQGTLNLRLRNPSVSTRVAVRAARYSGSGLHFPPGGGYPVPSARRVFPPHAQYVSGRQLGDEIRYVLERQYREIFAGTLLERPGLILNPWEVRETDADLEELTEDEAYGRGRQALNQAAGMAAEAMEVSSDRMQRFGVGGGGGGGGRPDIGFDFLPQGSRWWLNLRPEADGSLTLPLEGLEEQTQLEIVVMDRVGTSVSRIPLEDRGFEPREVRLVAGLDPEKAFSRQKSISSLAAGESVTFRDLSTTRTTCLQTVEDLFGVLQTLAGEPDVPFFSFLSSWPDLDREEKLERYHEFASHELHLFLSQRDPVFFQETVVPYLRNKLHKTFVDRWLLKELTEQDLRLDRLQHRNALELALLARRSPVSEAAEAALREAWELLPPDPEASARRIRVALQAGELDADASLARDQRQEAAKAVSSSLRGGERRSRSEGRIMPFGGNVPAPATAPPAREMTASLALEEAELDFAAEEISEVTLMDQDMPGDPFGFGDDVRRLYRALPKTKEWAEQNYYRVRAAEDVPERLPVNTFWLEVARDVKVSPHVLECHRNLTEVIAALAFCGLPFSADEVEEELEAPSLTLTSPSPALLVSEQILPAENAEEDRALLVSQQIFRPDDLYRFEGNERMEKFVTGECIRRVVYGARLTLTNPTATRRRLNLLMQIPEGAIPLRNGQETEDIDLELEGYTTRTVELFFTFPAAGTFFQFPAHVAEKERIVGRAETREFQVVDAPTEVDRDSWAWISQHGDSAEVLEILRARNLRRLDLDEIAWRLKDRAFFEDVTGLLQSRGLFHPTTFSYGVYHRDLETARAWLATSPLARGVGPAFRSPLLTVDPLLTKTYEHLEYAPLVNPRSHEVGDERIILNTAQREQYRSFLRHQMYLPEVSTEARLTQVVHLQLQDRLAEARDLLAEVDSVRVEQRLQLAYLQAWMALRELDTDAARDWASRGADTEIPRWRKRFDDLLAVLGGVAVEEGEDSDRQADLDRMAGMAPSLELEEVGGELVMTAYRMEEVTLSMYPMDIELMFSRTPFLADGESGFAVIRPAFRRTLAVEEDGERQILDLPADVASANVMVEISGRGQQASLAWLANDLQVRKMESFGQVEVRQAETGNPLPKTYVKVFARDPSGNVSFWKDGYTDLRGRFDYLSLNNRKPEDASELSILVLHPDHGAEILRAEPPVR